MRFLTLLILTLSSLGVEAGPILSRIPGYSERARKMLNMRGPISYSIMGHAKINRIRSSNALTSEMRGHFETLLQLESNPEFTKRAVHRYVMAADREFFKARPDLLETAGSIDWRKTYAEEWNQAYVTALSKRLARQGFSPASHIAGRATEPALQAMISEGVIAFENFPLNNRLSNSSVHSLSIHPTATAIYSDYFRSVTGKSFAPIYKQFVNPGFQGFVDEAAMLRDFDLIRDPLPQEHFRIFYHTFIETPDIPINSHLYGVW